jgi:hypothetical protein
MKQKSKKKVTAGIIIAILICFSILYIFAKPQIIGNIMGFPAKTSNAPGLNSFTKVSFENFPQYLESQDIMKDMPDSALISIKFYKIDKESKVIEKSYIIRGKKVGEGVIDNPDIGLSMDSKYIRDFSNGFCATVSKAMKNKELDVNTRLSQSSLTFKYLSITKYLSCFA